MKKLEAAITVAYAIPGIKEQGWTFEAIRRSRIARPTPSMAFHYLHQAYTASDPPTPARSRCRHCGIASTRRVVNNESSEIIRMLNSEFKGIAGDDTDFYPPPLRAEIDRINDLVYAHRQ